MIDNFELIKSLFYFNEANDMFFHLQIVQRAKDHKGENKKVKESAIKTYFIRSREHLDRVKEEVRTVPTLILVDDKGNVVKRHSGLLGVQELKEFCNEAN